MKYQGPQVFQDAVRELSRLPGIGEKTAQRLAFHLIQSGVTSMQDLSASLSQLAQRISFCSICCGVTEEDPCPLCQDSNRDGGLICVVEDPSDLFAVERSGQYRGVYHVLHGRLSPLDGMGPEEIRLAEFVKRIETTPPREVILATNPDVEGDATALYLAKFLAQKNIPASRIAMGIPMGGHLEYADQITLGRAIAERRHFSTT